MSMRGDEQRTRRGWPRRRMSDPWGIGLASTRRESMATSSKGRFIVRAEIRSSSESVISYGIELTATSIFVMTEWHAAIGTPVSLRLSFPQILEPIDLPARISDIRIGGEPDELGKIRLTFDGRSSEVAQKLVTLLERINAPVVRSTGGEVPCRVLLVDDSQLVRDMFAHGTTQFFDRPGALTIDDAEDAEQAWVKLASSTYDLVIVDYILPAEDGASLIAKLRRDSRLAATPIIAISVAGRDAREATLSAGADVFVDKPLIFRDLLNTLRMLSERRRRVRPAAARQAILVFDDSPFALA